MMEATSGARQPAWFLWLNQLIGVVGVCFGSGKLRAVRITSASVLRRRPAGHDRRRRTRASPRPQGSSCGGRSSGYSSKSAGDRVQNRKSLQASGRSRLKCRASSRGLRSHGAELDRRTRPETRDRRFGPRWRSRRSIVRFYGRTRIRQVLEELVDGDVRPAPGPEPQPDRAGRTRPGRRCRRSAPSSAGRLAAGPPWQVRPAVPSASCTKRSSPDPAASQGRGQRRGRVESAHAFPAPRFACHEAGVLEHAEVFRRYGERPRRLVC